MENSTAFVLRLTPLTGGTMQQELEQLLRTRTERFSRRRFPKVWAWTDRLNRRSGTQSAKKRPRVLRAILGLLLYLSGLFLLLPGLLEPGTVPGMAACGGMALALGGAMLWLTAPLLLGLLSIPLGVILVWGACLNMAELGCFLAVGCVLLALGAAALLLRRRRPFRRAARAILAARRTGAEGEVRITPEGVTLWSRGESVSVWMWDQLELAAETGTLYAFVRQEQLLLLEKAALCQGEAAALAAFLQAVLGERYLGKL